MREINSSVFAFNSDAVHCPSSGRVSVCVFVCLRVFTFCFFCAIYIFLFFFSCPCVVNIAFILFLVSFCFNTYCAHVYVCACIYLIRMRGQ